MTPVDKSSQDAPAAETRQNRRLAECYDRGIHLMTHEKAHDYAHAMFAQCVAKDPGCLPYVEAMIKNLRTKIPVATKARCKLARDRCRMLGKAVHKKDWRAVIQQGVELLGDDPWDITLLRNMAEACAALHLNEVELVYLKQALDAAPDNAEVNRHCAHSLGRMGQFDQSIACWHRVEKLIGKDAEATRMIAFLASEKLKYPGGRPPVRPKKNPEPLAEPLRNIPHQVELNPCQTLHTAIVEKSRRLPPQQQSQTTESIAKEPHDDEVRSGVPWFEWMLTASLLLLVIQLVPAARAAALKLVDVRHWSRPSWFVFTLAVLASLVLLRFNQPVRSALQILRFRRRRRVAYNREKA